MIEVNKEEILDSFIFPGGEVHLKINQFHRSVEVKANLRDSDDIMELLLVSNALKNDGCSINKLIIPYIPYARQDRICNTGEPFSIKVMTDLINGIKAERVEGWDVHSDVTNALIDNFTSIPQYFFTSRSIELERILKDKSISICSPDAGALKKIHKLQEVYNIKNDRLIVASKERNVQTGDILSTSVDCTVCHKNVIILDDICDGGRTFIEIAKVLKNWGTEKVYLYVTHGIFSKGMEVFDGLIDHVYTTDSFCTIKHPKLTVMEEV